MAKARRKKTRYLLFTHKAGGSWIVEDTVHIQFFRIAAGGGPAEAVRMPDTNELVQVKHRRLADAILCSMGFTKRQSGISLDGVLADVEAMDAELRAGRVTGGPAVDKPAAPGQAGNGSAAGGRLFETDQKPPAGHQGAQTAEAIAEWAERNQANTRAARATDGRFVAAVKEVAEDAEQEDNGGGRLIDRESFASRDDQEGQASDAPRRLPDEITRAVEKGREAYERVGRDPIPDQDDGDEAPDSTFEGDTEPPLN